MSKLTFGPPDLAADTSTSFGPEQASSISHDPHCGVQRRGHRERKDVSFPYASAKRVSARRPTSLDNETSATPESRENALRKDASDLSITVKRTTKRFLERRPELASDVALIIYVARRCRTLRHKSTAPLFLATPPGISMLEQLGIQNPEESFTRTAKQFYDDSLQVPGPELALTSLTLDSEESSTRAGSSTQRTAFSHMAESTIDEELQSEVAALRSQVKSMESRLALLEQKLPRPQAPAVLPHDAFSHGVLADPMLSYDVNALNPGNMYPTMDVSSNSALAQTLNNTTIWPGIQQSFYRNSPTFDMGL
ncbi:hypothetical protein EIP91_011802 [Steccherinum ochraceum]|uniref:Uncharacterized protein n=1 Tax=Steccherinum ochraceum TaxID=92696 RepID=A0A4R0RVN6_9APHY|nr:hypothetical protein EIP91_011802 [Steccherinum ochraceum]